MTTKQIKELFYSNGFEVYGPISYDDFCENKYYKSTMIWYDGLDGWISICEIKELKHLVGTMSTPNLDSIQPQSTSSLTPPLSKKIQPTASLLKNNNKAWLIAGAILVLVILGWFILGKKDKNENGIRVNDITDSLTINEAIDSAVNSIVVDTNTIIKDATTEAEKKTHRMNWEKFVTVQTNDFRKIELGGIDNLKLMITNTSPYKIDFVKVYVEYLKANNDTAQTAILEFHDIKANETKELFAPDSKRGVSVRSNITNVKSYGMNFCWDRKVAAKKGEDPFKCK